MILLKRKDGELLNFSQAVKIIPHDMGMVVEMLDAIYFVYESREDVEFQANKRPAHQVMTTIEVEWGEYNHIGLLNAQREEV